MAEEEFAVSWVHALPIVSAPAEIDITNAERLREALLSCAGRGEPTLVVDMTRTEFCDSSGLHQLVLAHKRAAAAGGELRLVIRADPVLRVLAVTGADRLMPIFATVAEATQPGTPAAESARPSESARSAQPARQPG
jgi:anti-sigma B factor antagonist